MGVELSAADGGDVAEERLGGGEVVAAGEADCNCDLAVVEGGDHG